MAIHQKLEDGTWVVTAGGTRFWICTQAAHDRAVSAGTAPNNCIAAITDDYPTEGYSDITDRCSLATGVTGSVMKSGNVISVALTYTGTLPNTLTWAVLPALKKDIIVPLYGWNTSASTTAEKLGTAGVLTLTAAGNLVHGHMPNLIYTTYFLQFTYIAA